METDIWGQLALEASQVYLTDGVKRSPFADTVIIGNSFVGEKKGALLSGASRPKVYNKSIFKCVCKHAAETESIYSGRVSAYFILKMRFYIQCVKLKTK